MSWARWSASSSAVQATAAPAPAPSASPAQSEEPSSDEDDATGEPIVWEVTGGRTNGLQVRTGPSLSSPLGASKLSTGALVRQRRLVGNRLSYVLLEGTGPSRGWVTITLGSKALLVRKLSKDEEKEEVEEQAAEESPATPKVGEEAEMAGQAVACSKCLQPFQWSDFAKGDYAEGWDCENLALCGNGSNNCGPFRWFCSRCQVDVCRVCFERRQGLGCPLAAPEPCKAPNRKLQAPKPSSKFAWDYPLSQVESRQRCLASDTVAGNMRRLTELQDRNADLEAERGMLLARVEHLESLLRRCCQPKARDGHTTGELEGSREQDPKAFEPESEQVKLEETLVGGADDLSLMREQPGKGTAVTCLCFGQERSQIDHILLAVAYADGLTVLYRCDKSSREAKTSPLSSAGSHPLFPRMDASAGDGGTGSLASHVLPMHSNISVSQPAVGSLGDGLLLLRRLAGHTRGVSSMSFGPSEEQLLTASRDRSLRIWDVSSGVLRAVFTDACLVGAAAFSPLHLGTFAASVLGAASSSTAFEEEARPMRHSSRRASLRLVSAQTSTVLHALPAASDVHALCFDGSGRFLLAGTKRSSLLALEVAASGDRLLPRLRVQLGGVGKVTSIVQAPVAGRSSGSRERLLVGAEGREGSQVSVAECVYAPESAGGHLLSIVPHRQVFSSDGPLRYCYCPSGAGLLISGLSDGGLLLRHLDRTTLLSLATPHRAAVASVCTSSCGAFVASADVKGRVAIWRCCNKAAGSEVELSAEAVKGKCSEQKAKGAKQSAKASRAKRRCARGAAAKEVWREAIA